MEKRLIEELLYILQNEDKPSIWIEKKREKGELAEFFPELIECLGIQQNAYHKYDLYYHLIYSCDAAIKKLNVRLAALMHDIGKVETRSFVETENDFVFYKHEIVGANKAYNIMKRWELPKSLIKNVVILVRYHMFHYKEYWTDSAVRRFINRIGSENIEDLFYLRIADREGNGFRKGEPQKIKSFRKRILDIIQEDKRFKIKDLSISGHDIINMGVKEGPLVGKVLRYLYEKVLENNIENKKEILVEIAREFIGSNIINSAGVK